MNPYWSQLLPGRILLFSPLLATTAQAKEGGRLGSVVDAGYVLQLVGSLMLVVICIFLLLLLLKKLNRMPGGKSAVIRVVSSVRLGSREKVLLLDAGGTQLLVGVAGNGMRTLHVFDEALVDVADSTGNSADFSSLLRSSALGDR